MEHQNLVEEREEQREEMEIIEENEEEEIDEDETEDEEETDEEDKYIFFNGGSPQFQEDQAVFQHEFIFAWPHPEEPAQHEEENIHEMDKEDSIFLCDICFGSMYSQDHCPVALECGHVFGKRCLAKWFKQSKICPKCKSRRIKETKLFLDVSFVVEHKTLKENLVIERKKMEEQKTEKLLLKDDLDQMKNDNNELQAKLKDFERLHKSQEKKIEELELAVAFISDDLETLRNQTF